MTANTNSRNLAKALRLRKKEQYNDQGAAQMRLICLTQPDDADVWVAPSAVVSVRAIRKDECPGQTTQTCITFGGGKLQYVREPLGDVVLKLNIALRGEEA